MEKNISNTLEISVQNFIKKTTLVCSFNHPSNKPCRLFKWKASFIKRKIIKKKHVNPGFEILYIMVTKFQGQTSPGLIFTPKIDYVLLVKLESSQSMRTHFEYKSTNFQLFFSTLIWIEEPFKIWNLQNSISELCWRLVGSSQIRVVSCKPCWNWQNIKNAAT
jgi:hypothetical protein